MEFCNVDEVESEDVPRGLYFFPDALILYACVIRLEISLLFSPALGIFHFYFFLSVFFLPVQSKVRRLPTPLLCRRPRTRSLLLVPLPVEVGE